MSVKMASRLADSTEISSAKALDGLDPARRSAVERRADKMPVSARRVYIRAVRGKASPRAAIKAHCLECMGWERQGITECTGWACPLWAYRPFQVANDEPIEEKE